VSVSQSILEILKTITIVIVFKISKMDRDICQVAGARGGSCRRGP
jgi:hypothetical protein